MKHRRFFPEVSDLFRYCQENGITHYHYKFTFAYGYELIIEGGEDGEE